MLKGAAAASLAAFSVSCATGGSSSAPVTGSQAKSPAAISGLKVIFFGLWAFWYGQASPADASSVGILAFSPDVQPDPSTQNPGHSYTTKFKKGHSELTLEAGVPYWIATQANASQTGANLWNSAHNHDAGMFLGTSQGSLIVNPLSPPAMRALSARTIWLPYPDDIVPVATVDTMKLFAPGTDFGNADKKNRWPMVTAFVYGSSTSIAFNDGVSTATGSVNLHVIVQPSQPISHDGGKHAGDAWTRLLKLIPKNTNPPTFLDIAFASNLPDDMGVCSDPTSGVGSDDGVAAPPCKRDGSASSTPSKVVKDGKINPSNCAAGCGLEIGP